MQVYSPLELLLFIAGCCTIADSFVPQLISVPKATVTHVVRVVLSMSFVIGAATVVYNLKSRFCKEQAWQVCMLVEYSREQLCVLAGDVLCVAMCQAILLVAHIKANMPVNKGNMLLYVCVALG